jgi:hypothetical protein
VVVCRIVAVDIVAEQVHQEVPVDALVVVQRSQLQVVHSQHCCDDQNRYTRESKRMAGLNPSQRYPALFVFVLTLSAVDALLNTAEHFIFELALRCKRNPFATDRSLDLAVELCVHAHLTGLQIGRADLDTEYVTAAGPFTHVGSRYLTIVLQLALGRDHTLDEDNGLAQHNAFSGLLIAVFFIDRYLTGLQHLFYSGEDLIARCADDVWVWQRFFGLGFAELKLPLCRGSGQYDEAQAECQDEPKRKKRSGRYESQGVCPLQTL